MAIAVPGHERVNRLVPGCLCVRKKTMEPMGLCCALEHSQFPVHTFLCGFAQTGRWTGQNPTPPLMLFVMQVHKLPHTKLIQTCGSTMSLQHPTVSIASIMTLCDTLLILYSWGHCSYWYTGLQTNASIHSHDSIK